MVVEIEKPTKSEAAQSTVDRVITLGAQILRNTYSEESFPLPLERPEKPSNLEKLVETCCHVTKSYYGELVYQLSPENFHWVAKEEFAAIWDERPSKKSFNMKLLATLGAKSLSEEPLSQNTAYLRDESFEPPQIFILADQIPYLESTDLKNRTFDEFRLAYRLISYCIFYSRIPREYSHEILDEELERNLERDKRLFLRLDKDLDEERFKIAIENLKYFIRNDETERTVVDGAEVKAYCAIKNNGAVNEENIAVTGDEFEQDLSEYLATKPLAEFCKIWAETYPDNLQRAVLKRFSDLLKPTPSQLMAFTRIEGFLKNIGLYGHRNIFKAHLNSDIPIRFTEARKKKHKLVYPQ